MTSDNLLKFLGNREYLHQVSYQELKSMVVQYPYSLSLRYLLAMKSQQEDNTDLDRNIEMLATYGIDRAHLHKIFSEDPIVLEDLEETIIMGEDYLELKELSALEREIEGNLVEHEINTISFLEEEMPIPSSSSEITKIDNNLDLPSSSDILESVVEIEEDTEEEENDSILEEVVAASAIIGGTTILNQEEATKDDLNTSKTILESPLDKESPGEEIPTDNIPEIDEEVEDFIVMDFEEDTLEEAGTADSSEELAPSEAFSAQDIEVDENGLPPDAVEINDYANKNLPKEKALDDLFQEVESEILAEEAVSDSNSYIDNPEALLVEESKHVLTTEAGLEINENDEESDKEIKTNPESINERQAIETDLEASTELSQIELDGLVKEVVGERVEKETLSANETIKEEEAIVEKEEVIEIEKISTFVKPRPQIPFEVSYSDTDPISTESINEPQTVAKSDPTKEVQASSRIEKTKETTVETNDELESAIALPEAKAPSIPSETFKFDSLNQLEAMLGKKKQTSFKAPVPKSGFSSWQEQFSGVGSLSGINLVSLNKTTGRVVRKKKKVIRKQFEKTVAFAEESLTMTEGIASETLAQLLVKQGQYSQARTMYKELCLIIPEKSSFFAGEIEKIQNLPDEPS